MIPLFLAIVFSPSTVMDHCDLIELNHHFDSCGRPVYDQVIFWRWDYEHSRYEVRGWTMTSESQPVHINRRSPSAEFRQSPDGIDRVVRATHFKESWTQHDPERLDKKNCKESDRVGLVNIHWKPQESTP